MNNFIFIIKMANALFWVIFVIFILIFGFLIYTAFTPKDGTLDRLGGKLALLGLFLVAIGIYISYLGYRANTAEQVRANTLKLVDRASLNIVAKINNNYSKAPNFINSLYFDWVKKPMGVEKTGENDWAAVNDISISIFGAFEDILSNSAIDSTGFYAWIISFLYWTNSEQLYNIWESIKQGYSINTIEFGDLLFRTSQRYKPQNGDQLRELGIALCCSPEMKAILGETSSIESCSVDCATFNSIYNDFSKGPTDNIPLTTNVNNNNTNIMTIPISHHTMM